MFPEANTVEYVLAQYFKIGTPVQGDPGHLLIISLEPQFQYKTSESTPDNYKGPGDSFRTGGSGKGMFCGGVPTHGVEQKETVQVAL